jgi:hypothetical protein
MESIQCAEQRIRAAISGSKVPEDPGHAEGTLRWLLELMPDADDALRLAALGHDIDRAIEAQRIRKNGFSNFDEFKAAHASHSAEILATILDDCGVSEATRIEACRLVRLHETGGDERSDVLKNADALSFFQDNISLYFERNGLEETKRRALWGYSRLSPELRHIVRRFRFDSEELNSLIQSVAGSAKDLSE